MHFLFTSLLFFLSAFSFDVEVIGQNGDRDKYIEKLQEAGITIDEVTSFTNLNSFGEWRKDGIIICEDQYQEDNVIDFINSGRSAVIFLSEKSEQALNLIAELGVWAHDNYDDSKSCSYKAPTQAHAEPSIQCNGRSLYVQQPGHARYYQVIKDSQNNTYAMAVQGNNDARIVIFSGEIFGTDEQHDEDAKGFDAVVELSLWAFRKSGVMRARDLRYVRLADGSVNPPELTISDKISFSIVLEVFDEKTQQWVGYDANDVQLQFSMLVPRIRKTLISQKNGTFSLDFQCPDIFGVYQFVLDYHARGFTPLNVTHQLMLHPLRHDEQPRYVSSAYPFYAAALVMCIAVVLLSLCIARTAPDFSAADKTKKD